MLRYSTTLQPPRRYPCAPSSSETAPPIPPSSQYQRPSCSSDSSKLCTNCKKKVWHFRLFSDLRNLPREQESFGTRYEIESKALKASVSDGCEWCVKLADGINGFVFLDTVYKEWGSTDSWPGSGSEAEEVTEGDDAGKRGDDVENSSRTDSEEPGGGEKEEEEEEEEEEVPGKREVATKNESSEPVGTFDEERVDSDPTGGWHSWTDGDILALDANFAVSLSFERNKAGQFTFLNAQITLSDNEEEGNALRNALRTRPVELRWRVNTTKPVVNLQDDDVMRLFPGQPVDANLGSAPNMKSIVDWSRERIELAGDSVRADSFRIPSRLIDVSEDRLRVVETANICSNPFTAALPGYAALSYVWGQNQTFVLLQSSEEHLRSSFSVSQLPNTIQDVVTVTREIGLRYLWVDALCIMQDSDSDKATELPKMRLIYQHAAITLVASIAKSANEGFLHYVTETDYFIPPIYIPIPPSGSLQLQKSDGPSLALSYPSSYVRHKDPINARAWTFQELILSPRCILFTYRGLEFIDREHIPAADGLTSGRDPQLPNLPWSGPMFSLTNVKEEDIRSVWLTVRGEYSRRKLSYEGDKLVAIAAVAEEVGKLYKGRYLAGLWESDLLSELKWCRGNAYTEGEDRDTMGPKPRANEYVAPTWSWASVRNPVDDYAFDEHENLEGVTNPLDFTVVSCDVEPVVPGFAYGAVKGGILKVSGRMHSFFWRPKDEFLGMESDGSLAVRAEDGSSEYQVGEGIVDASDPDMVDGCVVDCIAMGLEERIPGRKDVEGLMLLPIDDDKYRRVGFCKVSAVDLFEECDMIQNGMDLQVKYVGKYINHL